MKIIFYGKLSTVLGRELDVAVDAPCTIERLRKQIIAMAPSAAAALQDRRVRACVRSEIVADDHLVGAADEVEFLAPVSGG